MKQVAHQSKHLLVYKETHAVALATTCQATEGARPATPNPSIERTSKGLRPFAASHVKR
jgi:hypothetical protein